MKINKKFLYAGIVYDTLRLMGLNDSQFILSRQIKPLDINSKCYGPVFTNKGRIISKNENYSKIDAIRLEMYKFIKPNNIVVLQTNDNYCAHAGDITCQIYSKLKTQAFITDGIVRDSNLIRHLKYPCFCSSTNPIDALDYWGIVEYQQPISLPGISQQINIYPNDWIFADTDAIIVIPKNIHPEFEKLVAKQIDREQRCRQKISTIKSPQDTFKVVQSIFKKEGRW